VLEKLEKDQQVLSPRECDYAVEFINDGNTITDDAYAWKKLNQLLGSSRQ
jgi:hypothetical protein